MTRRRAIGRAGSAAPPGPPDETRAPRGSDARRAADPPDAPRQADHPGQPSIRAGAAESRAHVAVRIALRCRWAHRPRTLAASSCAQPPILPVVPFTKAGDFEPAFEEQLRKDLGPAFEVEVTQTADPTRESHPDRRSAVLRGARQRRGVLRREDQIPRRVHGSVSGNTLRPRCAVAPRPVHEPGAAGHRPVHCVVGGCPKHHPPAVGARASR